MNWSASCFGLSLLLSTLATPALSDTRADSPVGKFANVVLGGTDKVDLRKSIVISYRIRAESAEVANASIAYGVVPALPFAKTDYIVELLSKDERILFVRPASDPREAIVERHGLETLLEGMLNVRLNFDMHADHILLRDASGKELRRLNLTSIIEEFCKINSRDADCVALLAARGRR